MTRRSLSLLPALVLATTLALVPRLAVAGPVDIHGRPLWDGDGPIHYSWTEDGWVARHANGAVEPAAGPPPAAASGFGDAALPRVAGLPSDVRQPGDVRLPDDGGWPGDGGPPPRTHSHSAYTLDAAVTRATGSSASAVAIGDVTGDGLPDVVITTERRSDPANDYHVFVFPQQVAGTLGASSQYPYGANATVNGLVLTDFDEDGLLDVIVGHGSGISVLLADGAGGLGAPAIYSGDRADTLAAMRVDCDEHVDIIALAWSTDVTIYFGDGMGGVSRTESLATNASGYNDHEVEDMNGDGRTDLVVMSGQVFATPDVNVHHHDGLQFLPGIDEYTITDNVDGLGLGDVTGDGLHDVVVSRGRNSPTNLWILAQDGLGALTGPTSISSYDIPQSIEVGDLDGDGTEDVAVVHGGWTRVGIYLQDPVTGLDPENLYTIPYASHYDSQGIAIGDFSGDGCGDVAIADSNNGLVTLLGQNCFVVTDADSDGAPDGEDNCPTIVNPGQGDLDGDGAGDPCDPCPFDPLDDAESDGHCADVDICPCDYDPLQEDTDSDGVGDGCDVCPGTDLNDGDSDGTCEDVDNCPGVANPGQQDEDSDGTGDHCDPCPLDPADDEDSDGHCANDDNCPTDGNAGQEDMDSDGSGDACDPCPLDAADDEDSDGFCANEDNCPTVANPDQQDEDTDGVGDACDDGCPGGDADTDSDGVCDTVDNCPTQANSGQEDTDTDGAGDACDPCPADPADDEDSDGHCADVDNCPSDPNASQADSDSDGTGDACDPCPSGGTGDVDSDGTCDEGDNCVDIANPSQADVDSDGLGDACDPCAMDPLNDTDSDGACQGVDNCPSTANADQADMDSDGAGDACDPCPADPLDDEDSDGICGDVDNCPSIANADQADADSDGTGDACDPCPNDAQDDVDGDGVCGDADNCPGTANPGQGDLDSDGLGDACDGDQDGDGTSDVEDCLPRDPDFALLPEEVAWVGVTRLDRGDGVRVEWTDDAAPAGPGATYDVAAGDLDDLHADRGFVLPACRARALDALTLDDEPARSRWYLVRVRSDCELGTYGRSSHLPNQREVLDAAPTDPCP